MDSDFSWDKIGKFFAGECSMEEEKRIRAWIESDPEREKLIDELREIWNRSEARQQEWDTDKAWEEISGRLEEKGADGSSRSSLRLVESVQEELEMQRSQSGARYSGWSWSHAHSVAASLIFLAVVLLSVYLLGQQSAEIPANQLSAVEEVVTERGQRSQFRLNDGTRVWLNAGSRLEIPDHFNTDHRSVKLEGEAFFAVEPDSTRPFIVRAGNSVTKVLGTEFNVHAYSKDNVEVLVEEGKVAFGNDRDNIDKAPQLIKNQMGVLPAGGQPEVREITDLDRYLGWRKGHLVFRDTRFTEVMTRLERWFDIECTVTDSILNRRTVTATFKDESMTEVLEILTLSLGIEYQKENREVTFIPKSSNKKGQED